MTPVSVSRRPHTFFQHGTCSPARSTLPSIVAAVCQVRTSGIYVPSKVVIP
ncbi:hypothetical protein CGRA01v4_03035 [Colletotrichum graminicola]|nr:hypothetical protein CGRA01v4_03035 [Colletotrichum graminicola]